MKNLTCKQTELFPTDDHILPYAEMGFKFDYFFEGKRLGEAVELHVTTTVLNIHGKRFNRKTYQMLLNKKEVKPCIEYRIREHFILLGIEASQIKYKLKDFTVDMKKGKPIDRY